MKKIAFISQPEYFGFIYRGVLDRDYVVQEFPFHFTQQADLGGALRKFDADYNIFFRGEFVPQDVLTQLRGVKIALSSEPFPRIVDGKWEYTEDSIERYLVFRKICDRSYDYIFHYDRASLPLFKKDAIAVSGEFVFPVALNTYKKKSAKKKWDFFFIGRSTPHREELFGPLKHEFNFLHIAHGISGEDLVDYMNQSTICINAHAENEISWEPRMQMMLATGAFVLSEKITPNPYLRPGKEFIEFSDAADLYVKAGIFLKNDKARQSITSNALAAIGKHFDASQSLKTLIAGIDNNIYEKFKPRRHKEVGRDDIVRIMSSGGALCDKDSVTSNSIHGNRAQVTKKPSPIKSQVVYLLPDIGISGGVAVVLQHVNRLKKRGHDVAVINLGDNRRIDWFTCDVPVYHWDRSQGAPCPISEANIAIATHFSTAKVLNHINTKRKIYFVQSDERRFGLNANEFVECEASYGMPVEFMTEAKWIQRWLKEEFRQDAYYVPNGLDEKIFFPTTPIAPKTKRLRVLLEGPIGVPFKGMDDSYNAVKDLDCELWIVSSGQKPKASWRYDRFFEKVPMRKMNEIYSACDIFLKMSKVEGFFGPPLEAMACGCVPVVAKCTGFDEYIEEGKNALAVEIGDVRAARSAVVTLLRDTPLRKKMAEAGKKTAAAWSWDRSVDFLEKVIANKSVEVFYDDQTPRRYHFKETMLFYQKSVIEISARRIKEHDRRVAQMTESIFAQDRKIKKLSAEIALMQSSKFWKLREWNEKIKFGVLHPVKFLRKYLIPK